MDKTFEEKYIKLHLIDTLINLKKAWRDVAIAFDVNSIDINDYICEKYPFEKSFDEIEVGDWVNECVESLKITVDTK